jgi:hypothetical protein
MLALSRGLLRAGLQLKVNQVKRATSSYLRDRTDQATGTLASYVIAAGLFAASGIFLIAASLVGLDALFRWVEINYGLFWAFGAVGLLLLVIAGLCAGLAASRLHRPARQFPSLTSRLRVAIKASPLKANPIEAGSSKPDLGKPDPAKPDPAKPDQAETATDTATAILRAPASPSAAAPVYRPAHRQRRRTDNREVQAGLVVAATLLGWAAARRVRRARRPPA